MINVLSCKLFISVQVMVLIFDGNSETCAHVWRYLFRSRAVTNLYDYFQKRSIFLHLCATCSGLPSNISTAIRINASYIIVPLYSIRFIMLCQQFFSIWLIWMCKYLFIHIVCMSFLMWICHICVFRSEKGSRCLNLPRNYLLFILN